MSIRRRRTSAAPQPTFRVVRAEGRWRIHSPDGTVSEGIDVWLDAACLGRRMAREHPPAQLEIFDREGQLAASQVFGVGPPNPDDARMVVRALRRSTSQSS